MSKKNTLKGFTLIELILYIGISSFILLAITLFATLMVQGRIKSEVINEVEQQGYQTMQIITQAIRNAQNISSPTSGSAQILSLNMSDGSVDPTQFTLQNGKIYIQEASNQAINLTNNQVEAGSLNFTNLSRQNTPGIIHIEFTLSHINPEGKNEYSFQKTFKSSASLRSS